ncbi:MAG: DUF6794 domain-containing protein [Gemmatimonadaceae bacterium]
MTRILFVFSCIAVVLATSAHGGTYIPKDLDDAHRQLMKIFSAKDIEHIKSMKSEDEMIEYHMGLGMGLRNEWGLWKGSRLSQWFNQRGIFHPDDMSGIIFDTFWDKLHNKPFRLPQKIDGYQEYWRSMETPKEGSPKDGAKIAWVITRGSGRETVHLGISASDRSYWRYQYGTKKLVPATQEDAKQLDELRKTWKQLGTDEDDVFRK